MWNILSNISSICTLIGFVITLWQLHDLKTKIFVTEKGIRQFLDFKEHEELDKVLNIIAECYTKTSNLIICVNKSSIDEESILQKCQNISNNVDICLVSLSSTYPEITTNLKNVRDHIEKYMESGMQNKRELKQARDFLYCTMEKIKESEQIFVCREIEAASHRNV